MRRFAHAALPCAVGALLMLPGRSAAQHTTYALTRPEVEFPESFSAITSIRELSSGKVYLVDVRDKVVRLLDFATGTMTQVGREGQGPGEYAFPASLIPLPGDHTLLQDLMAQRFLTLTPEGKPGEILHAPSAGARLIGASGVDPAGRIYFAGSSVDTNGNATDSVAIARWDRKVTIDTVLKLPNDQNVEITRGSTSGGGSLTIRVGGGSAWPERIAWSVAPNGRLAIVTPKPYQVTWVEPNGRRIAGPAVPYAPLKVTEADKKAFRDARAANGAPRVVMSFGEGGAGRSATMPNIQLPEPTFPEVMPPFSGGGGLGSSAAVLTSPEGEVWVLRTRHLEDKTPTYDIFDGTGTLAGKATLAPNSRIIGFGAKRTVYVVRTDEDGLQYLQRFIR